MIKFETCNELEHITQIFCLSYVLSVLDEYSCALSQE